jgi:hypothetical protein
MPERRWTPGQCRWSCPACGASFPDAKRISLHECVRPHRAPTDAAEEERRDLAERITTLLRAQGTPVDPSALEAYLRRHWPPLNWDPLVWAEAYLADRMREEGRDAQ